MKLFEPGRIGRLSLRNRIVMAPIGSVGGEPVEDWRFSQRDIDFYTARAKGGAGLIITSAMLPSRRLESAPGLPVVNSLRCVRWLNDLAEAVHDYGAKICSQLYLGIGRVKPPDRTLPHGGLVSASAVPAFWDPTVICRELTTEEVEQLIKDFEFSAQIISSAGTDAIEINAHRGYLLDQFMTALWNKRTDKYGGNLDGRLRLPIELVKAVKRGAGTDFPVSYRYGLTHFLDGGRDVAEGLEIARRLEAAGVDCLHIDGGCYETNNLVSAPTTQPPGFLVHLAELTKKVVNIPVITVGKLGYPELAETVLKEGKADFIALGRSLLADPEWANKVKEGRPEDITPCIGCLEGCLKRYFVGKYTSCAVNPACGLEREFVITRAGKEKSVLVVGGGPAGMEAARVATLRGHKVTLWEKGHALGGNLIPAAIPDFKHDYRLLLDYLTTQIRKLGVTTRLGIEATPELIQRMDPDVVFIATGATPTIPNIPGIDKEIGNGKVATAVDVLLGKKETGERVIIIGAGVVGSETALYLALRGKKITVVEIYDAMRDLYWVNAKDLKEKLDKAKVKILTYTNVLEVTDDGIVIANEQIKKSTLEADTIVLAVGLEPNRELQEALQDRLPEVYTIGDCVDSRKVIDAIWEGFRTARLI
jgi:2-enoate reductase